MKVNSSCWLGDGLVAACEGLTAAVGWVMD